MTSRPSRGFFIHLEPKDMVSFVRKDYEILASRYEMTRRMYLGKVHGVIDRAAISNRMRRSDFSFSWFAYDHAFWAVKSSRENGKKSAVVLGGFDVCEEEDPALQDRLPTVRYILRNADRLLAVSNRVRMKALHLEPTATIDTVYHGFDASTFVPGPAKELIATTVAFVRQTNLVRKGLEVFVRAAARLPHVTFVVVGDWYDDSIGYLRKIASANVQFTGRINDGDLLKILQKSSVYVQASTHEGFGCSLAEAMLCECTPVVSDRGALPEVVGDTGIYVRPEQPSEVAAGILRALEDPERGRAARRRVARLFPLERRRALVLSTVEEMIH